MNGLTSGALSLSVSVFIQKGDADVKFGAYFQSLYQLSKGRAFHKFHLFPYFRRHCII